MAGLLDALMTPEAQLGVGLLAAAGPTPQPMSFGQRLAMVTQGLQAQKDQELRRRLLESQMAENDSQAEYRKAQAAKWVNDAEEAKRLGQFAFGGTLAGQGAVGTSSATGGMPSAGGVPPQGFSLSGMTPEQVMVAEKLGYKAAADLWKFQNSPQSVAANSYFRVGNGPVQYAPDVKSGLNYDPRTGRASVIDGADQAMAQITEAQEGAKARVADPRERVKITRPDGSEYEISRAEWLRMQGGGALGQGGVGYTGNPMVDAVMFTESRGRPGAVSPAGASGTMQTMPGTLSNPGFGVIPARDGGPGEKQRVGVDYWNAMTKRYGDPALAAVAYNWGPGNADRWIAEGGDFRKLPKETQDYVGQVMLRNGINATRGGGGAPQAPDLPPGAIQTGLSNDQKIANEAARVRAVKTAEAEVEQSVKAPKEEMRRRAGIEQADRMILKVDQALNKVGGISAGGGAGLSVIPGTTARNLDADLQTIKANLGFAELQAMRDASPTGGALGSVAQQELAALQSTVASLDQSQSPEQLRRNLNEVKVRYQNWKRTVEQAGGQSQPAAKSTTFDQLPPANQYRGRKVRADDGRILQSDGMIWKEVK